MTYILTKGNIWFLLCVWLQIKLAPKQVHPEQKDHEAVMDVQESNLEDPDHRSYATIEELNSGRLPPEEILSRPMFKVIYSAGLLSRLYGDYL